MVPRSFAPVLPAVWLLSFAASLMPFAAYEAHFFLVSFLLLAGAVSFAVLKYPFFGRLSFFDGAFLAPVFGFWGVAFFSVLCSEVPYVSFIYFCFFSVFPLSLFLTMLAKDSPVFWGAVGAGTALIFAMLSGFSLVQFFFLPDMLVFGRVRWPFVDPNALAGFLSLGFFGFFGLMISAKSRAVSNAALLLSILVLLAVVVTGSRGAVVSLCAGVIVLAVFAFPYFRKHVRCVGFLLVAGISFLFLTEFYVAGGEGGAGQRVADTVAGRIPVLWQRPAIWDSAWQIIREHFWTGTGIGTFFLYYPEVRGGDPYSAGRMAHSDPLQFWAEMGVFSPVLFYSFILVCAFFTFKAFKKMAVDDVRRVYIAVSFCALFSLVLHTHINFHLYILPTLFLTGGVLGYWFRQVRGVLGDGEALLFLPPSGVLKFFLIVPLLAVFYGFFMLQGSHIVYLRGDARGQAGDVEGFIGDLNKADRMAFGKNQMAVLMAARIKLSSLEAQGGMPAPDAAQVYDDGVALLDRVGVLNPRFASVPYFKARFARVSGLLRLDKPEDQEGLLVEALRLDPLYIEARMDLATLYKKRGESQKQYDFLKEGLRWKDASLVPEEFYQMLATAALAQGDRETQMFAMKMLWHISKQKKALMP